MTKITHNQIHCFGCSWTYGWDVELKLKPNTEIVSGDWKTPRT